MYDLLIKNGSIVDGGGRPAWVGDVAVSGGLIAELGPGLSGSAAHTLQAEGLAVAPGFIDVHSHDDLVLFDDPYNQPKLLQGVTTVVAGNCGFGPCPASPDRSPALAAYASPVLGDGLSERIFADFAAYAAAVESLPKAQNLAALAAHGALFINEMGFSSACPTADQAAGMQTRLHQALTSGALGLSAGLMYAPGIYCQANDLRPLVELAAKFHGLFCVHLRSESALLNEAVNEALAIQKMSGVSLHISHFKKVGAVFKGEIGPLLADLRRRIDDGLDLSFDMYPYTTGSTTMSVLFPPDLLAEGVDGCLRRLRDPETRDQLKAKFGRPWPEADNLALFCGWDNIIVASTKSEQAGETIGRSIAELAAARGLEPGEACLRIFEEAGGRVTVLLRNMAESDLRDIILSPPCLIASDGLPVGASPHPRLYGAFPRFLRQYVREERALTLEEAVAKMTWKPALRFGLGRRGLLRPGYAADLVIFDPNEFADQATFENPRQYPRGLSQVIVGGEVVVDQGEVTGRKPGRFLRRAARS